MSEMISKAKFAARFVKLQIPEGFSGKMETEPKWGNTGGELVYVLKSETVELRFNQYGHGSTNFLMSDGKWHTFDQRGVSASFYHLPTFKGDRERYDLNRIVKRELKRVTEQLERSKEAVAVPSIPNHTVTPKELLQVKKELKDRGSVTFMPAGFGTAHVVGSKPNHVYPSRRASAELEKFLGVSPLFVHTLEMD